MIRVTTAQLLRRVPLPTRAGSLSSPGTPVQTKAASILAAFDFCNRILDMSCLRGLLFAFAVCGLFLLSQAGSFAQDTPDNQPHIQPRSSGPAPTPRPTPKAQPPAPAPAVEPPAENQQPQ